MERVAFLTDKTGQRISCLLNPESLVIRRAAGVRPRRSTTGALRGATATEDQLLFTGGGLTELQLDLLFDVSLATSLEPGHEVTTAIEDVRVLTGPLWELAKNVRGEDDYGRPPLARFVWGKSWNIPGIVVALADRLECFTAGGNPWRSWLRMVFRQVATPAPRTGSELPKPPIVELPPPGAAIPPESIRAHRTVGGSVGPAPGEQPANLGERLDHLAHRYYGNPALWKSLAAHNRIDDPLHLSSDLLLEIPPARGRSEAEA